MQYLNEKSGRAEYAKIVLGALIATIATSFAATAISDDLGALVTGIAMLVAIPLVLAQGVRRLNDLGRSRWWIILSFAPVFNTVLFLIFLFREGAKNESSTA